MGAWRLGYGELGRVGLGGVLYITHTADCTLEADSLVCQVVPVLF